MNKIITISREFSSGGRQIGRKVAEALNLEYFDKELIDIIAQESGLSSDYISQYSEKNFTANFPLSFGMSFSSYIQSPSEKVFLEQLKVIRHLGETKKNFVILGRGADDILSEYNPFKVFIYSSDMECRIKRCHNELDKDNQKTPHELEKEILKIDKQRAKYYDFYTGKTWGEMRNYNLCIDSSACSIECAAKLIVEAIKSL